MKDWETIQGQENRVLLTNTHFNEPLLTAGVLYFKSCRFRNACIMLLPMLGPAGL